MILQEQLKLLNDTSGYSLNEIDHTHHTVEPTKTEEALNHLKDVGKEGHRD